MAHAKPSFFVTCNETHIHLLHEALERFLAVLTTGQQGMETTSFQEDISWFDVREWGVEGKGWKDTLNYYGRLPRRAEKLLPELGQRGRHATGLSCDFETNAHRIEGGWRLRLKQLDEPNMNRATFSGLDLYARDKTTWRWAGSAHKHDSRRAHDTLVSDMNPVMRRFRLYLPLRNPVVRLEIGVPRSAKFIPIAPRTTKPIVYYGSSIVHGAYASRAGVIHPSVLGRRLNRPVINLGFSGQAKMHAAMAHLLGELDPAVFVLDPLPNMDAPLVKERAEKFLRILLDARPQTPVVMVEDFPMTQAWIRPSLFRAHKAKWKVFSQIYRKLRDDGYSQLSYVEGLHSLGDDSTGSFDGIHPNDVGYERLANHLLPALRQIL